jgi:S-adenosylmethionine-diacylglycerol 3-amino-3-carboxypropyl transferase
MHRIPTLQYASCNEDARSELDALRVSGRRVVSIAAAGERAFALLLDDPREVVAVDGNPTQIYLSELKVAAMREFTWTQYLGFVGIREDGRREEAYRGLAEALSVPARRYWDHHIPEIRAGIMQAGRTERGLSRIAPVLRVALAGTVARLRASDTVEAQGQLARELLTKPLVRAVFSLLFNPLSGRLLLRDRVYYGDARRVASRHIAERLMVTLDHHRLDDCFILQLFLHGHLKHSRALPLALTEEGYAAIKQRLHRLRLVVRDIRSYLSAEPPGSIDAFSLSDLGGYLTVAEYSQLLAEVQRTAAPNATVCIREFISQPTRFAHWPVSLIRNEALERELERGDRSVGCTFVCASKSGTTSAS